MLKNEVCRDEADHPVQRRSAAVHALARADQQGDLSASALVRIVARAHGVTVEELFHHSRSRAPIAATRQLAMYLMHVVLGRSLTKVGQFFQRDRTTVSYACAIVEDLRDDAEFEAETSSLEKTIEFVLADQERLNRFLAGEMSNV